MKKLLHSILFFFVVLIFTACGPCDGNCGKACCAKLAQSEELQENPEPWQAKYDEVMEVHDAVMPEISTITKLKKALATYSESNAASLDEATKTLILDHKTALTKADEAMWEWMHQFKQPEKGQALEEVNAYLTTELESISKVSEMMTTSIKDAKTFLETSK